MRAPAFWHRPDGVLSRALSPVGAFFAAATARRVARQPDYDPPCPVISVGNANLGGTGKTPTVIALSERLQARGRNVMVITRGYGGALAGPVQVDPNRHTAADVGDEPLLHAAFCPTIVARDRAAGARLAVEAGAEVLLLDDGHQTPTLRKDLSLLSVDAVAGFGNGRVVPAGPLRESVAAAARRAQFLLSIGPARAQTRFDETCPAAAKALPRLKGSLVPLPMGLPWTDRRVLAFAGIGHPEKFFATLRAEGALVLRAEALADHQPLTPSLMTRLETEAKALTAQLVTTEKDFVRLPDRFRPKVLSLPVRLRLDDWTQLDAALDDLGL